MCMLLCPYNGAEYHCKDLKVKIDNDMPTKYFLCDSMQCVLFNNKLLSHYRGLCCRCGRSMNLNCNLTVPTSSAGQDGGVFVKGYSRLIISDDLQVMSPLSVARCSSFTEHVMNENSTTEQLSFNVGVTEVSNLLLRSLVSKTPFSETLLKRTPASKSSNDETISFPSQMFRGMKNQEEEKISVKLTVSKSKNIVCYAEAGVDFVNLLQSFLTLPLGFIVKQMRASSLSLKGCIDQLYKSVQELDEQYLKSNCLKEILLSPKIYPGFCYKNYLLGIDDGPVPSYYYAYWFDGGKTRKDILATDNTLIPSNAAIVPLELNVDKSPQGFLKGSTMFTVTDKLIIKPISPLLVFSVLNELKVPLTDIKEEIVQVGKVEALRLLVASFVGDSALTDVFIRQPKQAE